MDNQNKDGDLLDNREPNELKMSELLAALPERRSPSFDPRNISTSLSTLTNTGAGPSKTNGTFRSRATLPENIRQLSRRQFKRRDFLKVSLPIPLPAPISTAVASSQEEHLQPSLPSSTCVFPAHLVEKRLPSDSVGTIGERLEEREMHSHILGGQARTRRTLPDQNAQSGPTSAWFFEDLRDLQRKLFSGASKKSGVARNFAQLGKRLATTNPNQQKR